MHPYYQNQYGYQQPQYGYQQPQAPYQPHPQSQQLPNIQAMYNTVQPYNNKEFLLSIFGNKMDYIQVFLSLPH